MGSGRLSAREVARVRRVRVRRSRRVVRLGAWRVVLLSTAKMVEPMKVTEHNQGVAGVLLRLRGAW